MDQRQAGEDAGQTGTTPEPRLKALTREGTTAMTTEIKNGGLNVPDDAFWEDPWINLGDVSFEYVANRKTVMLLDGPTTVDINGRDKLPLAVFEAVPAQDRKIYPFTRKAVLAGVRLEDRLTMVAKAMETPPADRRGGAAPAGEGFSGSSYTLDARRQLGVPWQPGTWVFGVILLDRVSNRVTVTLEQGSGYKDEAVEAFLAEQVPEIPAIDMPDLDALPTYDQQPESPAIPEAHGVAVSVQRVSVAQDSSRAMLYGSYRLPVLRGEIVAPDASPAPTVGGRRVTAVLPITLIITRSDSLGAVVKTLGVPTFGAVDAGAEAPEASGYFALDLMSLEGMTQSAETHFVYTLVGDLFEGPTAMAFVDESAVPSRD